MSDTQPTFALPGDWWRIRLTDPPAAVAASVKSYVERHVGKADDRAQYRAQLREYLASAITQASEADARAMYFSQEISPGVPMAISLTTYHPALPPRLSWESGIAVAAESFAGSLHESDPDALIGVWSDDDIAVVRDVRITILTTETGDQEANLRVDYWLFATGQGRPWLLAFGSPLIWEEELEPLVGMLDAIVNTVAWESEIDTSRQSVGQAVPIP